MFVPIVSGQVQNGLGHVDPNRFLRNAGFIGESGGKSQIERTKKPVNSGICCEIDEISLNLQEKISYLVSWVFATDDDPIF
jgi:hypothetical protein